MSFLLGPASGALVAGGAYYGFSTMISTRTEQHQKDLHRLSVRLVETPSLISAPPSAAARIQHRPFASLLKRQWNEQVENLFVGFREWEGRAQDWGRGVLYGREVPPMAHEQS